MGIRSRIELSGDPASNTLDMTTTPDETILKEFRQRLKRQYSEDPQFVAVHSDSRTQDGVYEFTVSLKADKLLRVFFWKFNGPIASGQVAMDVATSESDTAASVVAGWMATRKIKEPTVKAASKTRRN